MSNKENEEKEVVAVCSQVLSGILDRVESVSICRDILDKCIEETIQYSCTKCPETFGCKNRLMEHCALVHTPEVIVSRLPPLPMYQSEEPVGEYSPTSQDDEFLVNEDKPLLQKKPFISSKNKQVEIPTPPETDDDDEIAIYDECKQCKKMEVLTKKTDSTLCEMCTKLPQYVRDFNTKITVVQLDSKEVHEYIQRNGPSCKLDKEEVEKYLEEQKNTWLLKQQQDHVENEEVFKLHKDKVESNDEVSESENEKHLKDKVQSESENEKHVRVIKLLKDKVESNKLCEEEVKKPKEEEEEHVLKVRKDKVHSSESNKLCEEEVKKPKEEEEHVLKKVREDKVQSQDIKVSENVPDVSSYEEVHTNSVSSSPLSTTSTDSKILVPTASSSTTNRPESPVLPVAKKPVNEVHTDHSYIVSIECGLCNKRFESENKWRTHLILIDLKDILCARLGLVQAHLQVQGKTYNCPVCPGSQNFNGNFLLLHYFMKHEPVDAIYRCHLQNKQQNVTAISPNPTVVQAQKSQVQAVQKSLVQVSRQASSEDEQVQCPTCSFYFPHAKALEVHVQKKHKLHEPADQKCQLCGNTLSNLSFVKHIVLVHFKEEICRIQPNLSAPFQCIKCGYKTDNKHDIMWHYADYHQEALRLYYEQVQKNKQALVVKNYGNISSGGAKMMCFLCMLCKTQQLVSPVHQTEDSLKVHLVKSHFKPMIENSMKKELELSTKCPHPECKHKGLNRKTLIYHFTVSHGHSYGIKDLNLAEGNFKFVEAQRRQCLECGLACKSFEDMTVHTYTGHKGRLERLLAQFGVKDTLVPVQPTRNPTKQFHQLTHKEMAVKKARNYHSLPKRGDTNTGQNTMYRNATTFYIPPVVVAPADGTIVTPIVTTSQSIPNVSLLRNQNLPQPVIANSSKVAILNQTISTTVKATENSSSLAQLKQFRRSKPQAPKVVTTVATVVKREEEKPRVLLSEQQQQQQQLLRRPTWEELVEFTDECVKNKKCYVCKKDMWTATDNGERRKLLTCRHLFRDHFYVDTKTTLLKHQVVAGCEGTHVCPQCRESFVNGTILSDHYAAFHKKVMVPAWQFRQFNTTTCREEDKKSSDVVKDSLNTFTSDTVNQNKAAESSTLEVLNKFRGIPFGTIVVQPKPCFDMSDDLDHCHECWKLKIGQGVIGSICQFEGFRKVKRVQPDYKSNSLVSFEPAGFLDPHADPGAKDVALWTPTDPPIKNLDRHTATMILLRAGDEFCNLVSDELQVIAEYKRARGDVGCVIWKRLEEKVREMCDVCSTSLFNAHWTCTECGIIVCLDCHRARIKGNLAYSGQQESKPYKSRRKLIRSDLDDHYWPMCKDVGPHVPNKLVLTQIICGDVLQDVWMLVHKTKRNLGLELNCKCCQKPEIVEEKILEVEKVVEESEVEKEEDIKVVEVITDDNVEQTKGKYKDVLGLKRCPICSDNLNSDKPMVTAVHMLRHFQPQLQGLLSTEIPLVCPYCSGFKGLDVNQTMLHIGLEHGEFSKELRMSKKKMVSIENVVLKVDSEARCKVCAMDYNSHLMTSKTQIRTHLFTHFRGDILKNVLLNDENKKFECPICGVQDAEKSYFSNHLGIFHKLLDKCWDNYGCSTESDPKLQLEQQSPSPKKKMSFSDYKKKFLPCDNNKKKEEEEEVSIVEESEVVKGHFDDMISCPICDMWDQRAKIKEHLVHKHFGQELCIYAKDKGSTTCQQQHCSYKISSYKRLGHHYGLVHGMLETLLNDALVVDTKRKEFVASGSCSSVSSCSSKRSISPDPKSNKRRKKMDHLITTSKPFQCLRCDNKMLSGQDHSSATLHFAQHVWVDVQTGLSNRTNCSCGLKVSGKQELLNHINDCYNVDKYRDFFFDHELVEAWLVHNGLLGDNVEAKNIWSCMEQKVRDILNGTWCCLCNKVYEKSGKMEHYADHYIHIKGVHDADTMTCDQCGEKFDQFKSHVLKQHEGDLENFLTDLEDVESVETCFSVLNEKKKKKKAPKNNNNNRRSSRRSSNASSVVEMDTTTATVVEVERHFCTHCKSGYVPGTYYKHMSLVHFRKALSQGLPEVGPFKCPTCIFEADDQDELIVHYAQYHKHLEYILKVCEGKDNTLQKYEDVFESFYDSNTITKEESLLSCKKCKFVTNKLYEMRQHVLYHMKMVAKSHGLPNKQPFICTLCYYEAATFLSLYKHFGTSHSAEINNKHKDNFVCPDRNISVLPSHEAEVDLTHFQIKAKYNKKQPQTSCKQVCQKGFLDMMKDILDPNLIMNKSDDDMVEKKIEEDCKVLLVANVHPPPQVATSLTTENKFKDVPHMWLCDGRLLLLLDPKGENNRPLFQDQWLRGQPVVICNSSNQMDQRLWHPEAFLRDFGHLRHDLINCLTGKVVPKAPLDRFWKGFQTIGHRMKDANGTPMLLKLKDWPPTEDIAVYMPKRYHDLINSFPLPEYTKREGILNLAGYLPEYCLKPELGPKMYIAYGSALYSSKGSTNLHIDMSDAVNCLVYVGFPSDGNMQENAKEVFKEIDKAGCDILMKRRVRSRNQLPGALWHIFHPCDTVKIRDLLNKVALEKGKRLDPHDDPIHDQSTYLDAKLRLRLYQEYGVQGYAIVQCAGDTVFIPAGAAHQVRNLHNCIKVAEDFVSPENISHCLHLTQEFRHLTEWHTNHEDKLQIKTILYHAIKTAVTVLKDKC